MSLLPTTSHEYAFGQHTKYYIVRDVSKGAYSTVHLVRRPEDPLMKIALKKINVNTAIGLKNIEKEYDIHKSLMNNGGHENFIKILGMKKELHHYVFFMEYADNGTLSDLINTNGQPPATVRKYFRQLITGIEYMHKSGITHCDIKPSNLLLNKFEILKITDFGLSCRHLDGDGNYVKITGHLGTRPFAAPEVWKKSELDGPPTDIWSTGIVLVELLSGTRPWETAMKIKSITYRQWAKKTTDLLEKPWCMLDYKALNLATSILCPDVEKRFTIQQIQEHEWYRIGYESSIGQYEKELNRTKQKKTDGKTSISLYPMSYRSPSTSIMMDDED